MADLRNIREEELSRNTSTEVKHSTSKKNVASTSDVVEPSALQVILPMLFGFLGVIYAMLQSKWTNKSKNTVALLILFWPIGLIYMATSSEWSKRLKVAVSSFMFIWALLACGLITFIIFTAYEDDSYEVNDETTTYQTLLGKTVYSEDIADINYEEEFYGTEEEEALLQILKYQENGYNAEAKKLALESLLKYPNSKGLSAKVCYFTLNDDDKNMVSNCENAYILQPNNPYVTMNLAYAYALNDRCVFATSKVDHVLNLGFTEEEIEFFGPEAVPIITEIYDYCIPYEKNGIIEQLDILYPPTED